MNSASLPIFELPEVKTNISVALRDYQLAAIEQLDDAFERGNSSPLLTLPTGSGKTVIAAELIRRELDAGGTALFLAPRRELIFQASKKLSAVGVSHGVVLAGADHLRNGYARAQVASIDTLRARMVRKKRLVLLDFSLVIMDEAHLSITKCRKELLDLWPKARRIGLTATPTRKDGRALGMLYDALVEPTSTAQLTEHGYLAPARYFSLSEPDLRRVGIIAGDYNAKDLDAATNCPELVGDVVQTWLGRAADRRTVVFCCSISHSAAMTESFLRAGVAAEHVDANTPPHDREATFKRFSDGDTQVLTNCLLASYGFDLPVLSCVVLARPTKSLMLYLQMIGRGLRIAPGKTDCLILDHSGCVHEHGFAHDDRRWTLEGDYALVDRPKSSGKARGGDAELVDCPECAAIFSGTRTCPECGFYLKPRGQEIETLDGELIEIGAQMEPDDKERLVFLCELRGYAIEKGYKPGWAGHTFRERFNDWPPREWSREPVAIPSLKTRRWIKSRKIRWLKAREKQRFETSTQDDLQ